MIVYAGQQHQISLSEFQPMSQRSKSSHQRTQSSMQKRASPINFRVILKSRNGLLDDQDSKSTKSIKDKLNVTSSTFQKQDIKKYVKLMKSRPSVQQNYYSKKNSMVIDDLEKTTSEKRSTKSRFELQCLGNQSGIKDLTKIDELSLIEIQRKVDQLVELKLLKSKQSNTQKSSEIDEINKQINAIVQYLYNYAYIEEQRGNVDNIQLTNKRISILEKIMAEGAAQSQIAKKLYAKKTNRKPKIQNIFRYKTDISSIKQRTRFLMDRTTPVSLHFQTINKQTFKAPHHSDYPKKTLKNQYEFKSYPIPRSSYDRDYFKYGSLPKFTYRDQSQDLKPPKSSTIDKSSYQADFTQKKIEGINFKQLDCYKDKLRDIKISFIPVTKKLQRNMTSYLKDSSAFNLKKGNEVNKEDKRGRSKSQQSRYIQNFSTENKVNYRGENNKIVSQIKHKNLYGLKYAYRAKIHV